MGPSLRRQCLGAMAGGRWLGARDAQLTPTAPGEAIQATVTSGQSPAYTESSSILLTNMGSKSESESESESVFSYSHKKRMNLIGYKLRVTVSIGPAHVWGWRIAGRSRCGAARPLTRFRFPKAFLILK